MKDITLVRLREYADKGKTPKEKIINFLADYPGATSPDIMGATGLPYTSGMGVVYGMVEIGEVLANKKTGGLATYQLNHAVLTKLPS